jgi:hypothetical protein
MIPNIQKIKPLRDLPNAVGFKFTGVTHEHNTVQCEVVRRNDGIHTVKGACFSELLGWINNVV